MSNHLHQIEAELKPLIETYLDMFLLMLKTSFRRVNQGQHKQKKEAQNCKKASSNNRPKTFFALQCKTCK